MVTKKKKARNLGKTFHLLLFTVDHKLLDNLAVSRALTSVETACRESLANMPQTPCYGLAKETLPQTKGRLGYRKSNKLFP